MSTLSPHVGILFMTRPTDKWGRKQGWLACVRCTLDGAAMKPLIVVRQPDRSLGVMPFDWVELPKGKVIRVDDLVRGLRLDDPLLSSDVVEHVRDAVLARARAEGIR